MAETGLWMGMCERGGGGVVGCGSSNGLIHSFTRDEFGTNGLGRVVVLGLAVVVVVTSTGASVPTIVTGVSLVSMMLVDEMEELRNLLVMSLTFFAGSLFSVLCRSTGHHLLLWLTAGATVMGTRPRPFPGLGVADVAVVSSHGGGDCCVVCNVVLEGVVAVTRY